MNNLLAGAILGGLGVALGAFGAHGLSRRVDAEALAIFEVGVRYQMLHALALVALGVGERAGLATGKAPWLLVAGVVLFSGSLYGLALGGPRWLGPVTPVGGVLLIAGWVLLAVSAVRGS